MILKKKGKREGSRKKENERKGRREREADKFSNLIFHHRAPQDLEVKLNFSNDEIKCNYLKLNYSWANINLSV